MMLGYEYSAIDKKRFALEEAWLFAAANNGKKLTAYERKLDLQEKCIGKSDEEIKRDKNIRAAEYRQQHADLQVYWQELRDQKKRNKEKEGEDEQELLRRDNGEHQ